MGHCCYHYYYGNMSLYFNIIFLTVCYMILNVMHDTESVYIILNVILYLCIIYLLLKINAFNCASLDEIFFQSKNFK